MLVILIHRTEASATRISVHAETEFLHGKAVASDRLLGVSIPKKLTPCRDNPLLVYSVSTAFNCSSRVLFKTVGL